MKFPKSKIGWALVVVYIVLVLYILNAPCEGWICGPSLSWDFALIPFSIVFDVLFNLLNPYFVFGVLIDQVIVSWPVIVFGLVINLFVFYWIGLGIEKIFKKLFIKKV